ncbi:hypothetical protein GW796_09050 [archaeon]|nr:hypothetical protein [archaeon]NCT58879.1 hypothetical protein [archaeon]
MRKYENETIQIKKLSAMKCDICGMDILNSQHEEEATSIINTGGYNSVFGDGLIYSIDICQYCLKEKLGQYIHYFEDEIV